MPHSLRDSSSPSEGPLYAWGREATFETGQINPDWVISGDPEVRGAALVANSAGTATSNFWECTAGRFEWHYTWDEIIMILEGEVSITSPDGSVADLRAGDVAHFPAGSSAVWNVAKYVRKIAFHSKPVRPSRLKRLAMKQHRIASVVSVLAVILMRIGFRR